MASHGELSDIIKNVHINLRLSSREVGAVAAWEQHCQNSQLLKNYSQAMKDLATSYWETNNAQDPNLNRIYWVLQECENFFLKGGFEVASSKEIKLFKKFVQENERFPSVKTTAEVPIKMLDVGSCYNPFKKFQLFDVTAIDIAPATDDVIECDFLKAELGSTPLGDEKFGVVLFSFLLEYLPEPKMRYVCCQKAYNFLKPGGILLILTPDSKHDTANSRIMKNWRFGLASIGFLRINYTKLKHLRCMTFYKCFDDRVPKRWLQLQKVDHPPEESIVIPQDSNPYEARFEMNDNNFRSESDNNRVAETFTNMVCSDIFSDRD